MRTILSLTLAALVLMTSACKPNGNALPSLSAPPSSASVSSKASENPVQNGGEFTFADLEDYAFTMMFEPRSDAKNQHPMGVNIPRDYDSEWLGESEFDSYYNIFEYKTKKDLARVRINTAPPDLEEYFKTEDRARIRELMRPAFFPTEDMYSGLKKAVVEDFEYKLVADQIGTAYGWDAFTIEFIDESTNTHAIRFYTCNDMFDESFYAFEFKADLPADDAAAIQLARDVLFSLHPMNVGVVAGK